VRIAEDDANVRAVPFSVDHGRHHRVDSVACILSHPLQNANPESNRIIS